MADKHDTPPVTRQSSDTMKEPDHSTMHAINMPNKIEPEKPPADDTHSSADDSKQESKEEKGGSMNAYFVGHSARPPF
jgi:hypothetical protein